MECRIMPFGHTSCEALPVVDVHMQLYPVGYTPDVLSLLENICVLKQEIGI